MEYDQHKMAKRNIMIVSTVLFIVAFTLNIVLNEALFNYNLNVVPDLQKNSFLSSQPFIVIMNLFSNIFNPIICAGYVILIYLLSHRKLQIIVFLIWFICLSVLLSIVKQLIHQPRPYWVGEIKMLQWICYTEYGCPSGHAMLGLVIIEFLIRYSVRTSETMRNKVGILYVIGFLVQMLVVFSRILLGMHSLNQVLMGFLMACYSFIPYYLYMEEFILKLCMKIPSLYYRGYSLFINMMLVLAFMSIQIIITYAISYDNNEYWQKIQSIEACKNVKIYSSFQYRCLRDTSLITALFGLIFALIFLKKPQNLMKRSKFRRKSIKFLKKILLTIILALIPLGIFLNPLWSKISLTTEDFSLLIWFLYSLGLMSGMFLLIIAPNILEMCKLQLYSEMVPLENERRSTRPKSRQLTIRESEPLRKVNPNDSLEIPKQ